jgi:hypothetical protein
VHGTGFAEQGSQIGIAWCRVRRLVLHGTGFADWCLGWYCMVQDSQIDIAWYRVRRLILHGTGFA